MNCNTRGKSKKVVSLLLSVFMVFTLLGPITSALTLETSAAVKIKTTKQANSLLNKGAIRGIDVSKWQGNINWSKVATENVQFAFIRSSYGTDTDPYFVKNAQEANKNGIAVGAYHYARFKDTASMQREAQFFINQLQKVKITYPVALDLENHFGLSRKNLTTLSLQFIQLVEDAGYTVMLYSYQNFINDRLDKSRLADTKMWVANYQQYPQNIPHHIWQHTSYGSVSGISGRVDINLAYSPFGNTTAPAMVNTPNGPRVVGGVPGTEAPKVVGGVTKTEPPKVVGAVPKEMDSGPNVIPGAKKPDNEKADGGITPAPTPSTNTATQTITVNRVLSQHVKTYLNENYGANLPMEGSTKLSQLNQGIARGLQRELNAYFLTEEEETGRLMVPQIENLSNVDFTTPEGERILRLLQCKLVFTGLYVQEPNGEFDSATQDAVVEYQKAAGLAKTGDFNKEMILHLFGIVLEEPAKTEEKPEK